jgi:hypothetical protein
MPRSAWPGQYVHHPVEASGRDEAGQTDNVHLLALASSKLSPNGTNTIPRSTMSKVAGQHHAHTVFADVVHCRLSLAGYEDFAGCAHTLGHVGQQ